MKIVVVGLGYVGLSTAVCLAQRHTVVGLDIIKDRADKVNNRIAPLKDELLENYLKNKPLTLTARLNDGKAYDGADFIIIALPTNYSPVIGGFDTKTVEQEIERIYTCSPDSVIVIKSTMPAGFAEGLQKKYPKIKLIVSPEFLREEKALFDCLHPSRIIAGIDLENDLMKETAESYLSMIKQCIGDDKVPALLVDYTEAEAIKLFSNSYLALRVAFFNELDTFAEARHLDTKRIIDGVCLDKRIGSFYNNPSFGYGGYCLPKDTKEMLSCYKELPQAVIKAAVEANGLRASYIAKNILERLKRLERQTEKTVGIYHSAKSSTRQAAVLNIIRLLAKEKVKLIIYESDKSKISDIPEAEQIINLEDFKKKSDIILANRYDKCLDDIKYKVYTRDIFRRD